MESQMGPPGHVLYNPLYQSWPTHVDDLGCQPGHTPTLTWYSQLKIMAKSRCTHVIPRLQTWPVQDASWTYANIKHGTFHLTTWAKSGCILVIPGLHHNIPGLHHDMSNIQSWPLARIESWPSQDWILTWPRCDLRFHVMKSNINLVFLTYNRGQVKIQSCPSHPD